MAINLYTCAYSTYVGIIIFGNSNLNSTIPSKIKFDLIYIYILSLLVIINFILLPITVD